jgi:response regulator of citrate/malate metabolism
LLPPKAGEKLQAHANIIILDNNLPDGTGLEYLQMHPEDFMESYVIMITANPSTVLRRDATCEGIRAFLPKPFSVTLMKEILHSLYRPKVGLAYFYI